MEITKKDCKNKYQVVTEIVQKKKKKENMEEINTKIFLKKVMENYKNTKKATVTPEKWHYKIFIFLLVQYRK